MISRSGSEINLGQEDKRTNRQMDKTDPQTDSIS